MAKKQSEKESEYIQPHFVKNAQGKTTHVFLTTDDYNVLQKQVDAWEKIQKEKGVRWVTVSKEKASQEKKKKVQ